MNSLSQPLFWCCLQVTVLAVAALAIGTVFSRRRPAAGAVVAASALFAVVGLTAMALSPWPSWRSNWDHVFRGHVGTSGVLRDGAATSTSALRAATVRPALDGAISDLPDSDPIGMAPESEPFLQRLSDVVANHGLLALGVLYLVGLTAMAVRIAWGLAAVRGYRRDSLPLSDRRLLELVDVVRAELGCKRPIEVRTSARSSTPATVGWRQPVLLLPVNWRTWTDEECLAVLAHEIEHVRRGDFASWVVAQFGLALHFYHPLVHWLAARLRLEQELAADAAAARVLGGQRKYVTTLAAMALRQSDAVAAWPARAFLPTSKTFLRRIEMLHRSKSLRGDVSRPVFYLSIAAVATVALCAAGLRESAAGDDGQDAAAPSAVPSEPAAQPHLPAAQLAVSTNNHLAQMALAMHNYHDVYGHFPPAAVIGLDGKTSHSWRVELLPFLEKASLYREYRMNEPWDSPTNKKILDKMPAVFRSPFDDPKSTKSGYYVFTGPGTLFDGRKGTPIQDISDGTTNTLLIVEAKRDVPWTKPEDIPFDPTNPPSSVRGFVEGQFFAALADGSRRMFENDKVKDQLTWLILRNDGHPIYWDKIASETSPKRRRVRPAGPVNQAVHDKNNLKMLALAMHNYHDVNRHFPAAVVIGPDGKTPHSWRVELLPFLDAAALYQQYRMNEPWDSPANKQIIEHIPDALRSPYDNGGSTNSGYYFFAGPDTAAGARIRDITDGTSNTILIVEAKRDIPWTKPEDIPFDPDKPAPTLGGFVPGEFAAAMCDGSFRRYRTDDVKDYLKWLIIRNDGNPIPVDNLRGGGR